MKTTTMSIMGVMLIIIVLVGTFFVMAPFAAVAGELSSFDEGTPKAYGLAIKLGSDSKGISNLMYRYEIYGPKANTECYSSALVAPGWVSLGLVNPGNTKTALIQIPENVYSQPGTYHIVVYTKDRNSSSSNENDWKVIPLSRTAYDDVLYASCLSNPVQYGVPSSCASTACRGAGYSFIVRGSSTPPGSDPETPPGSDPEIGHLEGYITITEVRS